MVETVITATPALEQLLRYGPIVLEQPLSIDEFTALYVRFPELLMERSATGKVKIMSPVKKGSGRRESLINTLVGYWAITNESGETYSPSTGIELATGAVRSLDCAWVSDERLAELGENSDEQFLKVVPDFVVEIRSSTDRLKQLKSKIEKIWMANGVRLAWLIDPYSEKVWIYREKQEVEEISGYEHKKLSGEDILNGLEIPLDKLKAK